MQSDDSYSERENNLEWSVTFAPMSTTQKCIGVCFVVVVAVLLFLNWRRDTIRTHPAILMPRKAPIRDSAQLAPDDLNNIDHQTAKAKNLAAHLAMY